MKKRLIYTLLLIMVISLHPSLKKHGENKEIIDDNTTMQETTEIVEEEVNTEEITTVKIKETITTIKNKTEVTLGREEKITSTQKSSQSSSKKEKKYKEYFLPETNGFKSYMSYATITDKTSLQYKLQYFYAYTGNYGIRMINDRYCIALGTAFGIEVGTYVDLILENGEVIKCILSDIKADEHTEDNNIITALNGCATEFIVDEWVLNYEAKITGDISKCNKEWDKKVIKILIYKRNILKEE